MVSTRGAATGRQLLLIQEEYQQRLQLQSSYTGALETLIRSLIERSKIPVVQIESRTKTVQSLAAKVRRKQKYDSPLQEIQDLSGIRVVTYLADDAVKVGELLHREFLVDESAGRVPYRPAGGGALDDRRPPGGYEAHHFVVRLSKARSTLPEWESFASFQAEVQVRSTLQHAWACLSQFMLYKNEEIAPPDLVRRLADLSLVFQESDSNLVDLRRCIVALSTNYNERVRRGQFDLPVDFLSIGALLDDESLTERLEKLALDTGWRPPAPRDSFRQLYEMDRDHLIGIIGQLRFTTLRALHDTLDNPDMHQICCLLCDLTQEAGGSVEATPEDVFGRALATLHKVDHSWLAKLYTRTEIALLDRAAATLSARRRAQHGILATRGESEVLDTQG